MVYSTHVCTCISLYTQVWQQTYLYFLTIHCPPYPSILVPVHIAFRLTIIFIYIGQWKVCLRDFQWTISINILYNVFVVTHPRCHYSSCQFCVCTIYCLHRKTACGKCRLYTNHNGRRRWGFYFYHCNFSSSSYASSGFFISFLFYYKSLSV